MLARRGGTALAAAAIARFAAACGPAHRDRRVRAPHQPKHRNFSSPAAPRPGAACQVVFGSCLKAEDGAISLPSSSGGGAAAGAAAAAPASLPTTVSTGLFSTSGSALCSIASQHLLALRHFSSTSSSLGDRLRSSTGGGSSGGGSSSEDRSGLSNAELHAAAERLMRSSRDDLKQPQKSSNTDESMRQRMVLLLQLGFSQAAIEAAVESEKQVGRSGGPYIVEQHVGEAVALLRRWGFSQQQLDRVLAKSDAFTRAAADIEAVLAWLQRQFGMKPGKVVRVCSTQATLLAHKQATLESNWRAFEAAFQPAPSAQAALTAALRSGRLTCITLPLATIRWGPVLYVQ